MAKVVRVAKGDRATRRGRPRAAGGLEVDMRGFLPYLNLSIRAAKSHRSMQGEYVIRSGGGVLSLGMFCEVGVKVRDS